MMGVKGQYYVDCNYSYCDLNRRGFYYNVFVIGRKLAKRISLNSHIQFSLLCSQ